MKRLIVYGLVLLSFINCSKNVSPSGNDIQPGDALSEQKTITLIVDGYERNFIVYLPFGYNKAGKLPVIHILHGGTGTPEGMMNLANFKPIADRDKIILVYPAGVSKNWNDGRPTTPNQLGINDVNFINQICDFMIKNFPVDGSRIYATGISNGGFMSSRLGCELSNRIAAIAVVSATMEASTVSPACTPVYSVPALYIHGTSDPLVPFAGGIMTAGGTAGGLILSHTEVILKWVTLNKCSTTAIETDLPDLVNDGTTIKRRVFSGGTNASEVVSYVIQNGGHTWPQGLQYLNESIIGKTSQDMNANEVIWTFFKRFKRE